MAAKIVLHKSSRAAGLKPILDSVLSPSPEKVRVKSADLRTQCKRFRDTVSILGSIVRRKAGSSEYADGIGKNLIEMERVYDAEMETKLSADDYKLIDRYLATHDVVSCTDEKANAAVQRMIDEYQTLRGEKSKTVAMILRTCAALIEHKTAILKKDFAFLERIPSLQPLKPIEIDFVKMNAAGGTMKIVAEDVISKLFDISYVVYRLITSADSDDKLMSSLIGTFVTEFKKLAPRCGYALSLMEQQAAMFDANRDNYYRRMVLSGNPMALFESYIKDITVKVAPKDLKLKSELMQIMKIIREKSKLMKDCGSALDSFMGAIGIGQAEVAKIDSADAATIEEVDEKEKSSAAPSAAAASPATPSR